MPPRRRRPADPEQLVDAAVASILADLAAHGTPLERARVATQYLALLQRAQRQIALERIRDVGQVRTETALSLRAIARELGVSTNAIAQVDAERRGRPRRRRPPADDA